MDAQDAHKLGKNSSLGAFPARRGARTPPPCAAPSPRRFPTAPLPRTARLPCGKAGLVCLAYLLGAGSAQRTGDTRARAHCRATRYRTRRRATCRLITARLWLGQYSGPVCPQFFARGLPLADTEEPAPQGDFGMRARKAGAGSYLSYFVAAWRRATLALTHSAMPAARTSTIAVTQAADESKRTSRPYPYLPPGPIRIHKVVVLRPRFQGPAQCQVRFSVIQHRNRLIPRALAAAIAPFVHWDIRVQTAGIYLPIH